jgi:ammonium transporter, Amt family
MFAHPLRNAIKYSPAGDEFFLTVEDPNAAAQMRIRDQRAGIPPTARRRRFDRSCPVPATARQVQGQGVGLHLTKALVNGHGGRVEGASVLGEAA